MLKCGIVILNYNDYETTKKLLDLIGDIDSLSKIVVVDNQSTDGSLLNLRKYESRKISVLSSPENGGYSKGNNYGIRYLLDETDVDIIGISNPDVEFDGCFVDRILCDFEESADHAIITGLQMDSEGEVAGHPFWEEYTVFGWLQRRLFSIVIPGRIMGRHFIRKYIDKCISSEDNFLTVGAVEGSLFFIRRDDFEKVGLFDEGVWMYYEEDILAKKLHRIGKKIGIDKSIKYIHHGAVTTKKILTNKTKMRVELESAIYYFNNYQTKNKMLQTVNFILEYIYKIRRDVVMALKNLVIKIYTPNMKKEERNVD